MEKTTITNQCLQICFMLCICALFVLHGGINNYFLFRYLYYLQLKTLILNGKLKCKLHEALKLGSFAMQGKLLSPLVLNKTYC